MGTLWLGRGLCLALQVPRRAFCAGRDPLLATHCGIAVNSGPVRADENLLDACADVFGLTLTAGQLPILLIVPPAAPGTSSLRPTAAPRGWTTRPHNG